MFRASLRTIAALMAGIIPGVVFAAEEEVPSYADPTPYQVESKYPATAYPSGYVMDDNYAWEASYAFDPNKSYSTKEQEQILEEETALTGGTLVQESFEGGPVLEIDQGPIAEASQQNVPPAVEFIDGEEPKSEGGVATAGASNPFTKSYYRSQNFGNSLFGTGYIIDASMTATPSVGATPKKVEAYAEGKVFATALWYQKEIVRGRADISGQGGGTIGGTAKLYSLGQQIWSTNLSGIFNPAPINWSRTFFSASKVFMVGPVPVTVTGSVSGGVMLTVGGRITATVAKLNATPGGWANATATASVNIIIFSFGVTGSVAIVNMNTPVTAELVWPNCTLTWKLKADIYSNYLSGTLKVWVKIKFLFFKKTWWLTIASWPGYTFNYALLNLTGEKNLGC